MKEICSKCKKKTAYRETYISTTKEGVFYVELLRCTNSRKELGWRDKGCKHTEIVKKEQIE